MPGAVRLNDFCTGHGCYGSRKNIVASNNVFINGLDRGAHRAADTWDDHGCPVCVEHGGATQAGSPNVYVNSMELARIGDPVDCGSKCMSGSRNVIVNGPIIN